MTAECAEVPEWAAQLQRMVKSVRIGKDGSSTAKGLTRLTRMGDGHDGQPGLWQRLVDEHCAGWHKDDISQLEEAWKNTDYENPAEGSNKVTNDAAFALYV